MQKEIKRIWYFNQSPQVVWEYLTKQELLAQWLGETDFQPTAGYKFRFISPYGNHSYCEVLEVKPYTRLSYSWQKKSAKDNAPFTSYIEWVLVSKEPGTELHLLHHGFTTQEDIEAHEKGWTICSKQFDDLLNTINK